VLVARKVRGALLIGILISTVIAVIVEAIAKLGSGVENPGGWGLTIPVLPEQWVSLPDLSLIGAVSFGSFERIGALAAMMLVFTLVFTNFFDAMGTMTGLSEGGRTGRTRRATSRTSSRRSSSRVSARSPAA
jgi:AGZA family xanthine/uracil permease-like MFS transporter